MYVQSSEIIHTQCSNDKFSSNEKLTNEEPVNENSWQFFILVGPTNTGNGNGNGGDNGGDGSKKKGHSTFVYVLIGFIGLAAVLLIIIIIKIRRHKSMLSLIVSMWLQLSWIPNASMFISQT